MCVSKAARVVLLGLLVSACAGCATFFTGEQAETLDSTESTVAAAGQLPVPGQAAENTAPSPARSVAGPSQIAPVRAASPAPPEQWVRGVPGLDPATQARLLADLKQTDPSLWPQLLQSFRAAAAHRFQGAASQGDAPPQSTLDGTAAVAAAGTSSGLREHPFHPLDRPPATGVPLAESAQPMLTTHGPQAALAALNDPLDDATTPAHQVSYEAPANQESAVGQQALADAIHDLETQTAGAPAGSPESSRRQIALRLLCLAAGRRDDALRPIAGLTSAEQEFWSSQLFALSAWLDAEKMPAADRRANEALTHLDHARSRLAEIGTLQVRSPQFCTRVDGFGAYAKFKEEVFRPSQEVVLYVELENFRSESTDSGYRTALSSRYRILDSQGREVTSHEFPSIEEVCQNRRRDYYISFRLQMPSRVYDGRHTLQLTVEDTLGKKVGQTSIEFAIKE